MTPEQRLIWNLLSDEPARFAHRIGIHLQKISSSNSTRKERLFYKQADKYLSYLLDTDDTTRILRTMRTWLMTYQLPIKPDKLPSFERFHNKYGATIRKITKGSEHPKEYEI